MAPRASTRLAAKARPDIQAADVAIEASKKRSSSTTKHSRKKPKITQISNEAEITVFEPNAPRVDDFRRIRGRRGQLKVMTELPIDVVMEIFGHLQPYDLLCLSRASKGLRAIIVGENTSSLWKKAYANVPDRHSGTGWRHEKPIRPPSCPPQSNVLRFTNFLFGRGCQFCHASKASVVHWGARARMCNRCADTECALCFFIDVATTAQGRNLLRLILKEYDYSQSPTSEAHELSLSWYMGKAGVLRAGNYIFKREHDRHVYEVQKCADDEAKAHYKERCRRYAAGNSVITREVQAWMLKRQSDSPRSLKLAELRARA